MFVLNVRYIPLFRNKNSSKATGVESGPKISHFLTPYKIRKGVSKMGRVKCLSELFVRDL